MPRFSQLPDWLAWQQSLHPSAIDMGLERIYQVAQALGLLQPATSDSHDYSGALNIPNATTFTIAGTNGKGSCVKTIESCLCAQGHRVGSYTSPHLHDYNERICIDGKPVDDALICEAFVAIDEARGDISLTYFEFGTLAALWIFVRNQLPFVILEVGLGGRLDGVNIVDSDVAVVTSIDVDHQEWLGDDRETIALEKLGVARASKPVIIAEDNLTQSLKDFLVSHPLSRAIGQDFFANPSDAYHFQWREEGGEVVDLPMPDLALNSVVAGLEALRVSHNLPDTNTLVHTLKSLELPGRFQSQILGAKQIIFDVAHNPASAKVLADKLALSKQANQQTYGVFSVMADKDIRAIIAMLGDSIDHWYVGGLSMNDRAEHPQALALVLEKEGQPCDAFDSIEKAFDTAYTRADSRDRVIVFGSFFSVEAVQKHIAGTFAP